MAAKGAPLVPLAKAGGVSEELTPPGAVGWKAHMATTLLTTDMQQMTAAAVECRQEQQQ